MQNEPFYVEKVSIIAIIISTITPTTTTIFLLPVLSGWSPRPHNISVRAVQESKKGELGNPRVRQEWKWTAKKDRDVSAFMCVRGMVGLGLVWFGLVWQVCVSRFFGWLDDWFDGWFGWWVGWLVGLSSPQFTHHQLLTFTNSPASQSPSVSHHLPLNQMNLSIHHVYHIIIYQPVTTYSHS